MVSKSSMYDFDLNSTIYNEEPNGRISIEAYKKQLVNELLTTDIKSVLRRDWIGAILFEERLNRCAESIQNLLNKMVSEINSEIPSTLMKVNTIGIAYLPVFEQHTNPIFYEEEIPRIVNEYKAVMVSFDRIEKEQVFYQCSYNLENVEVREEKVEISLQRLFIGEKDSFTDWYLVKAKELCAKISKKLKEKESPSTPAKDRLAKTEEEGIQSEQESEVSEKSSKTEEIIDIKLGYKTVYTSNTLNKFKDLYKEYFLLTYGLLVHLNNTGIRAKSFKLTKAKEQPGDTDKIVAVKKNPKHKNLYFNLHFQISSKEDQASLAAEMALKKIKEKHDFEHLTFFSTLIKAGKQKDKALFKFCKYYYWINKDEIENREDEFLEEAKKRDTPKSKTLFEKIQDFDKEFVEEIKKRDFEDLHILHNQMTRLNKTSRLISQIRATPGRVTKTLSFFEALVKSAKDEKLLGVCKAYYRFYKATLKETDFSQELKKFNFSDLQTLEEQLLCIAPKGTKLIKQIHRTQPEKMVSGLTFFEALTKSKKEQNMDLFKTCQSYAGFYKDSFDNFEFPEEILLLKIEDLQLLSDQFMVLKLNNLRNQFFKKLLTDKKWIKNFKKSIKKSEFSDQQIKFLIDLMEFSKTQKDRKVDADKYLKYLNKKINPLSITSDRDSLNLDTENESSS